MIEAMRYALYLMPDPASALWRMASALVGYDAATGAPVPQPVLEGVDPPALWHATQEPRRYGFHLTLKAPFRLSEGATEAELMAALLEFCRMRAAFDLGALTLEARIGGDGRGFVCLVPSTPCPPLFLLEQESVRHFEAFRAPLKAQEIARRRPDALTPRQRVLLDAYGYPFVLDEFRPHFSLTGPVENPERWRVLLHGWLAKPELERAVTIKGIALLRQEHADAAFRLIRFAPFAQG